MFTKEEIKARLRELPNKTENHENGESLSLAMIIAGSSLFFEKQRSGEDFTQHLLEVAGRFKSKNKRILAILHDVVEDTDWELEELAEFFSPRIMRALDAVTKRKGELFFDFIERASQGGEDALDLKIEDIDHNSDQLRYRHVTETDKQRRKALAYNIAYHYLVDIKKTDADPPSDFNARGRSMVEYLRNRRGFRETPAEINALLDEFSSRPERLPVPDPGLTHEFRVAAP